jgi:hypothetical protein
VGPRTGLDAEARRKILCPCWGSNPDRPARSHTLYCLSYRGSSTRLDTIVNLVTPDMEFWTHSEMAALNKYLVSNGYIEISGKPCNFNFI